MVSHRSFLIVNDDARARFRISATLLRHFPDAVVQECQDLHTAIELLHHIPKDQVGTVVVAQQTPQSRGKYLIAALRAAHASVPIIWTGEPDESSFAESAGATVFLDKHAWLMIGTTVQNLL